jgi:hypothetical protein
VEGGLSLKFLDIIFIFLREKFIAFNNKFFAQGVAA